MMKKPTTKKLPEKQVARTVTAKGKPFMKLFSDEKFYQYPRYTNVFVSQYGNVISTTGTVPHLLTPQLESNNYLSVFPCKKGKKKKFYIHRLVAEVWCQKPDFEIPNCPLEVHHKLKVLRNSTIDVNFAMVCKVSASAPEPAGCSESAPALPWCSCRRLPRLRKG